MNVFCIVAIALNMFTKLKCCSWNIHGYYSREIGVKFSDPDFFLSIVKEADFLGITETFERGQQGALVSARI